MQQEQVSWISHNTRHVFKRARRKNYITFRGRAIQKQRLKVYESITTQPNLRQNAIIVFTISNW